MKIYFKQYKWQIVLLTVVAAIRQLFLVLAQQLNASVFDTLVDKQLQRFLTVAVMMSAVWVGVMLIDAITKIYEGKLTFSIQQSVREDIAQSLVDTDYRRVQSLSSGQYLSWLNNDVMTISQKGIKQYFSLVRGVSGVLFAAMAIIQYHWSLLVITLIGFLGMFYIPKLFDKKMYHMSQHVTHENEAFVAQLEDQVNGYPVYFAFSALSQFVHRIKLASESLNRIMMKQVKLETALVSTNFSINVFFQIVLTVVAALCYFNGLVHIGTVAIVGSLADIIFSGLGNMSYQLSSIKSVSPIFDKFHHMIAEDRNEVVLSSDNAIYTAKQLKLRYHSDTIFEDVSFVINKKDKCLLSGASGSGKSSLLKLLLGYYTEFEGQLLYKGHDVKQISSWQIAKDVIYLSQQTYMFEGTVRDNIKLDQSFCDDEISHILATVGVTNASDWLDMSAIALSGGQKQRVALARALIRKPSILICDEITSALDKDSAVFIEQVLLSQQDLTLIMITHSPYSQQFTNIIQLTA